MENVSQKRLSRIFGISVLLNILTFIVDGSVSKKELQSIINNLLIGCFITSSIYRGSGLVKWFLLFYTLINLLPILMVPQMFMAPFKNLLETVKTLCFIASTGIKLTTTIILFNPTGKRSLPSSGN